MQYNYGNRSEPIKYIVIHDTGNTSAGATAQANVNYFNGGDRQSSADYFVDGNGVVAYNPDPRSYYTWHCGDGGGAYGITNRNSIGIEICVNSDGNYAQAVTNTVALVKQKMAEYRIDSAHVVRHYDASRKNCPASMSVNGWAKWNEFKNRLVTKEVKKVKNLVVYNNYVDKRMAERLAEYLQCPTMDGSQVSGFDYSCVENVIGVGGGVFDKSVKTILKGLSRDDTAIAVLKYMKAL